ncbi:hypothetical protein BJV82DRAFT_710223 [Fennellomyces sp. T-0311]|nr:hypothetical protein BJV82DRAFT_710223 [Fennellomyces sp. T-0311]
MLDIQTLKQRPLSIFHLPQELLDALHPVEYGDQQPPQVDITATALENLEIQHHETSDALTCNTCDLVFSTTDRQDHRKHFSTDWHRYNIKRKLVLGLAPVSLSEFETMLTDLAESISGSETEEESENEDEANTLVKKQMEQQVEAPSTTTTELSLFEKKYRALAWFQATPAYPASMHFGVYRRLTDSLDGLRALQAARFEQRKRLWTIIMIGGGHFAGAVVDVNKSIKGPFKLDAAEVKMVAHKTFHRYTTRRKQGGAQSANDNAKGAANSAGAQIRRYNEQLLQQEVREVLDQWKQHINESEQVFVHAPSNNRKVVYNYDNAVLTRDNSDSIPFPTRRPTLSEVRRVFIELCTLKLAEADIDAIQAHHAKIADKEEKARQQLEKSRQSGKSTVQQQEKKPHIPAEIEKLIDLTKQGKEQLVLAHVQKHEGMLLSLTRGEISSLDDDETKRYPTLLHLAAHAGHAALVSVLIRDLDADPTIKSGLGKTAYEVAKDKDTRNAFRRCMCDLPSRWDWLNDARVPSPLTREAELEQAEKDRLRKEREAERRRKIEEERQKKEAIRMQKKHQEDAKNPTSRKGPQTLGGGFTEMNTANMTPEARLRLEREMRARAAEERMRRLQKK